MAYVVIDEYETINPPTVLFRGSYDACDAYCFKHSRDGLISLVVCAEVSTNRNGYDDVVYEPTY